VTFAGLAARRGTHAGTGRLVECAAVGLRGTRPNAGIARQGVDHEQGERACETFHSLA